MAARARWEPEGKDQAGEGETMGSSGLGGGEGRGGAGKGRLLRKDQREGAQLGQKERGHIFGYHCGNEAMLACVSGAPAGQHVFDVWSVCYSGFV